MLIMVASAYGAADLSLSMDASDPNSSTTGAAQQVTQVVVAFAVGAEVMVKLAAEGFYPSYFLRSWGNSMNIVLMAGSVYGCHMSFLTADDDDYPSGSGSSTNSGDGRDGSGSRMSADMRPEVLLGLFFVRLVFLARLARTLRSAKLDAVVAGLGGGLHSVKEIGLLLLMVFYVYAGTLYISYTPLIHSPLTHSSHAFLSCIPLQRSSHTIRSARHAFAWIQRPLPLRLFALVPTHTLRHVLARLDSHSADRNRRL
jgi:hypothetical protein